MITRPIPSSNEMIPVVGLGTWQTFDVGKGVQEKNNLRDILKKFYGLGGRLIDSSPMYGHSESVVGDLSLELEINNHLFMASKVWTSGEKNGQNQIQKSISRMQKTPMDLMQIHNLQDWKTHIKTLCNLKQQGQVKYIGITHYKSFAHDDLISVLKSEKLDFVQVNYSILNREAEHKLLPFAMDHGIAVLANLPFGGGALFNRVKNQLLPEFSQAFGCKSWGQFFLKYILSNPAITCAIPATSNLQHITDNMQAGYGELPDPKTRTKMESYIQNL